MSSPQWPGTLLVWCYDESGGYYDHVPPPKAVKPDSVAPITSPGDHGGPSTGWGSGCRPAWSRPYARPDYVSHVVHDHTSVLKLIETKWNLPALTYRDYAADNLLDSVDLDQPAGLPDAPDVGGAGGPVAGRRLPLHGPRDHPTARLGDLRLIPLADRQTTPDGRPAPGWGGASPAAAACGRRVAPTAREPPPGMLTPLVVFTPLLRGA